MPSRLERGRWILPISAQFRNASVYLPAFLFLIFSWKYDQVDGDNCNGGLYCSPPESCCGQICCLLYGSRDEEAGSAGIHPPQSHGPYTTTYNHYRLSFWNVWYFWLIVIFVVVSCFGGCGYWRRRNYNDVHLESNGFGGGGGSVLGRESDDETVDAQHRSSFVMHGGGGGGGLRLNQNSIVGQDLHTFDRHGQRHPLRFYPAGNLFNPPPYNEVTSKPDLYPLVQGGHDLKNTALAYVYATSPFIHTLLPYNSGTTLYLASPAESNSSSLFQSTTTASNYMYPPPYSEGGMYGPASVSTPGSMLSACTPTEPSLTTHFLSSTSPPMATTPTSQQYMSEVTTPADSLVTSPTGYTISTSGSWSFGRRSTSNANIDVGTTSSSISLANLVADIQNMTNRMTRFPSNVVEASRMQCNSVDAMTYTRSSSGFGQMDDESDDGRQSATVAAAAIRIDEFTTESSSTPTNMIDGDLGLSQSSYGGGVGMIGYSTNELRSASQQAATLSLSSTLSSGSDHPNSTRSTADADINPLRGLRLAVSWNPSPPSQITEGTNTSPTD